MGCKAYKNEFLTEKMEIIIEKKKNPNCLSDELKLDLNGKVKTEEELKNIYYSNLNNEQALVEYLNSLKNNNHMEELENELLLYFDVLSPKNRSVFTGLDGFVSSIDIFKDVIHYLSDLDFQEIKKMKYYRKNYDICERKKFLISKNFSNFSNIDLKPFLLSEKNNPLDIEYTAIQAILKNRKLQKISLENTELFFNYLIQSYFESIKKADEPRLEAIGLITSQVIDLIFSYIKLIQDGEKFSENDIIIIQILFNAPILAIDENSSIKRLILNIENNEDNNNYKSGDIYVSDNKLIFNYSYTKSMNKNIVKEKIEFENPEIYNINLIKKEIVNAKEISLLKKNKILKYVKIKYFQNNNFYKFNEDYWKFIRTLFKHILKSKTIETLFQRLYPNRIFIFQKEENINKLINSIIFVPYELYESYGCTLKPELTIFIPGLFEKFSKPIHFLSKSASFIILGIHEGCGHWTSSFYAILYQDNSLSRSTNFSQEILDEINLEEKVKNSSNEDDDLSSKDGGDILECLLFGRIIEDFSLNEILFLLDEKSYDVDCTTFKNNFKQVSEIKFSELYNKIPENSELFKIMKTLDVDKNAFKNIKNKNSSYFSFKRNGEIKINSKCGELRF